MKPAQLKFKVLNKSWTLRLLKKKGYVKKNGADSLAVTLCYKRTIDLSPIGQTFETIAHELVHAYLYEMCFTSTQEVTVADLEEVFADLLSMRGQELLDLAKELESRVKSINMMVTEG